MVSRLYNVQSTDHFICSIIYSNCTLYIVQCTMYNVQSIDNYIYKPDLISVSK